jgi:hypothetical protein
MRHLIILLSLVCFSVAAKAQKLFQIIALSRRIRVQHTSITFTVLVGNMPL